MLVSEQDLGGSVVGDLVGKNVAGGELCYYIEIILLLDESFSSTSTF